MRRRAAAPQESDQGPLGRRREFQIVAMAAAALLLVWFAVANSRRVQIEFWVHSSRAPLILVIVISGLLGALITFLALRRKSPRG